ncbi:MAG: hypothetical protein JOZ75_03500 [Candidatus Dormibacteraeota bacterium]|nr:hypothetical protein [Candidatus Dormibacteraeota bacterium]
MARTRIGLHIFIQNWRDSDASLPEKLRETVANQLTKVRTGRPCCGHPGQPGC